MNFKKMSLKALSVLLAAMMLLSVCAPAIGALGELDHAHNDKIHYVSLGASNTNGYGIRGYLPPAVSDDPLTADKSTLNVYGYKMAPEAAYPYQVARALEQATGKEVVLDQLAISSMRVEEVRMLLDDSYYGDNYTAWRFYNQNGDGWFAQAESGNANDGATALANLRAAYQGALANADVISVDMGLNNFGVFSFNNIKNILADGEFWKAPDFSQIMDINEELNYRTLKETILEKLTASVGMNPALEKKLDMIADTLAYASLGFCYNFDIVIEEIYKLNPDATVVVVSIQNMLHGVTVEFEGIELPLGDLYGELIDLVNLYTAKGSPFCEDYVYAYAGENGHASTFLDELLAWDGDPTSLTENMKDCFDMYDDDLYVRSIIEYMMVGQALSAVFAQFKADSSNLLFADDKYAFSMPNIDLGSLNLDNPPAEFVAYVSKAAPHIYNIRHGLLDTYDAEFDAIPDAAMKAETLATFKAVLNGVHDAYHFALNYAYGVVATVVREVALIDTIQIGTDSLSGYSQSSDKVMGYIFGEVVNGATQNFNHKLAAIGLAAPTEEYVFTMDKSFLEDPATVAITVLAARFDLGNSFFAHPSEEGHDEITEAVMDALTNGSHSDDFAVSKLETYLNALMGLVSEYYDEAYAAAYQQAEADGIIEGLVDAIDKAVSGLNTAVDAVEGYTVDAELNGAKAELIHELNHTIETLNTLKADLAGGKFATADGSLATLRSYEDDLDRHLTTIKALAEEIGFAADHYLADLTDAVNGYVAWATEMIASTYEHVASAVGECLGVLADELNGLHRELESRLAALEADLAALKAELSEATAAVKAEIERIMAKIAEVEAMITEIKAQIAEVEAQIEACKAMLEELGDRVEALISKIVAFVNTIDTCMERVSDLIRTVAATASDIRELIDALAQLDPAECEAELKAALADCAEALENAAEALSERLALLPDELLAFLERITTGEYVISEDSYYVAILGEHDDYADLLAEALGLSDRYGKQAWGALDLNELAKADFITVGYNETDLNGFAVNQVLGFIAETLNGEERASILVYADDVARLLLRDFPITEEAIDMCVEEILVRVNTSLDTVLDDDLLRDKAVVSLDWAALVGEENLSRVDEARDALYAELLKAGVPETYAITVDVVDYIFADPDAFGEEMSEVLEGFDRDEVYTQLGEKSHYTLEIPAADLALLAIESTLYGNMKFRAELSDVMETLAEINPDAAVTVLGQYNPFDAEILGDAYGAVAALGSAGTLYYAATMDNVTYVDIADVQTVYEAKAEGDRTEASIEELLEAYLTDPACFAPSEEGYRYVADRILNAYTVTCGHVWEDATCTQPKTCGFCGETEGEALGHVWTDATCAAAKTCEVCGETEGEALAHTWTAATCTVAKTCSVCGETEGEALGHKWTNATCTESKTCSVCGETEGAPTGHTWADATCTVAKTCTVCGTTEGETLAHTWTDATCTESKTCSVCGTTEGEALGHTWTDATCTVAKTCSVCGTTEGEALGHTWTGATCLTVKTCSVCGETEGGIGDHAWADATCTAPKTCTVCGEIEGEALGHTYANTCDVDCEVCGAARVIVDHAYGKWTVVTKATKEAEGLRERTCSVCGYVESEVLPKSGCASVLDTLAVIAVTLLGAGLAVRKKDAAGKKENI